MSDESIVARLDLQRWAKYDLMDCRKNEAGPIGSTWRSDMTFTSRTKNPEFEGIYDISPEELARCSANDVAMIDVREPAEYVGELGHIAEAQLVPLATIPEHTEALPKDKPVVFVCRSGGRSARATAYAKSLGFEHVYNMKGGMILWNSLGLPVVKS